MQPRVGNIEIEVLPIMKHVASILAVIVATTTSVSAAETRLSIEGPSGVLQGTLAAPDGGLKAPVAIIIPGSGPTDRDGNNPLGVTAGSYRLLAEALAAKGVSTIRIDKRGMFGSIAAAADADNVRMTDYAADVRAWGQEAQKRTSARCAWLMGHSEGSLIALITAQQPEGICGLILVAGAGRKMGDILREQLKANPANAPILPQALAAITELEAGRRVDVSGMHPALMALFRPSVQGFVIDQMSYDPAALLTRYAGPVLVLQGTTDLQVSMQDAQRLAGARPGVSMVALEGVNHILKIAPADPAANFATYANSALPIAPSLVEAIASFLAQHP
jgi:pimeloyl-ACP methyl ester carboxylesterase